MRRRAVDATGSRWAATVSGIRGVVEIAARDAGPCRRLPARSIRPQTAALASLRTPHDKATADEGHETLHDPTRPGSTISNGVTLRCAHRQVRCRRPCHAPATIPCGTRLAYDQAITKREQVTLVDFGGRSTLLTMAAADERTQLWRLRSQCGSVALNGELRQMARWRRRPAPRRRSWPPASSRRQPPQVPPISAAARRRDGMTIRSSRQWRCLERRFRRGVCEDPIRGSRDAARERRQRRASNASQTPVQRPWRHAPTRLRPGLTDDRPTHIPACRASASRPPHRRATHAGPPQRDADRGRNRRHDPGRRWPAGTTLPRSTRQVAAHPARTSQFRKAEVKSVAQPTDSRAARRPRCVAEKNR